jgi:hypothetical protein
MANIISIPNDNDPVMNAERKRIVAWAPGQGWIYTGYNDETDHLAQLRRSGAGAAIQVLDFDCHGNPGVFDHTSSATAKPFGSGLAKLPGVTSSTEVYVDACNTGLVSNFVSVPIAQTLADGTRCTVYGTKGYMTGTFAEASEECFRGPNLNPALPAYPGAQDAKGRNVWLAFRPRDIAPDTTGLPGLSIRVDSSGRVWASLDPVSNMEAQVYHGSSLTLHSRAGQVPALAVLLDRVMQSPRTEMPALRMAPDITVTYVRNDEARILDVYANGGIVRDRASGDTWHVANPEELATVITNHGR